MPLFNRSKPFSSHAKFRVSRCVLYYIVYYVGCRVVVTQSAVAALQSADDYAAAAGNAAKAEEKGGRNASDGKWIGSGIIESLQSSAAVALQAKDKGKGGDHAAGSD
jgi:hypothetical protein